jgi:hypothetical protein
MPVLKKVEKPVKVQKSSERKHIAAEYDALLFDYNAHDYVEVELSEGENKITVKNRLSAAAKRRNMWIKWGRGKANVLKFDLMPKGQDNNGEYE